MYMSFKEIAQEQAKPLDYKIETAVDAIKSGFAVCNSRAAIAFSGGKDSTVLWHLIKTRFPAEHVDTAVIFGNTGVEFPESLKFARELGREWGGDNFYEATPERLKKDGLKYEAQCQVLEYLVSTGEVGKILKADGKLKTTDALERACPPEMLERFRREGLVWKAGTPKNYWWCVDQYGWPILGKAASKLKARRINIDCFLRFSETASEKEELKLYYDMLRRAKISQRCCDTLKKEPAERIEAELGIDVIFKGLMADESHSRKLSFSTRGYIFKSSRKYINTPFYHCNPLAIWTDADIWEYIRRFNVPYSPLYDITYKDAKGSVCNIRRNGCMGCFTDYGRPESHMFVMRQTHPKAWEVVMRRGMAKQIQRLKASQYRKTFKKDYTRLAILDVMAELDGADYDEKIAWAIDNRPCAFD